MTRDKENRSFFQWIDFVIPYIYTVGIALILLWMIVASILIGIATIKEHPKAIILQTEQSESHLNTTAETINNDSAATNTPEETVFTVIVKPFVESNFNKVIFRGLCFSLST